MNNGKLKKPQGTLEELHTELSDGQQAEEKKEPAAGAPEQAAEIKIEELELKDLIDQIGGASVVADMVITAANEKFKSAGLTPMNELQALIIKVGMIGTIEKYKDTLGSAKPEIVLAAGGAWVLADKIMEAKAKKKAIDGEPEKKATEGGKS